MSQMLLETVGFSTLNKYSSRFLRLLYQVSKFSTFYYDNHNFVLKVTIHHVKYKIFNTAQPRLTAQVHHYWGAEDPQDT